MSSLWTPGGEHRVPDPDRGGTGDASADADAAALAHAEALREAFEQLSPEERAQAEALARDLAETRERIASMPASVIVANHVMGLYELGAIHLGEHPPRLTEAKLAIDAMAAVVEALPGRLGEHEPTLREALHQIRLAFVQVSRAEDEG